MGPRQGRRWLRFSLSPRPPLPPRAVSSQRFPMHESIEPWVGAHRTAVMAAPPALHRTGLRGWRGMGGLVGLGEVGERLYQTDKSTRSTVCLRLSCRHHMSGENLVKFLLGTLDRVRERDVSVWC